MRKEIGRGIRNFVIFVAILVVTVQGAMAGTDPATDTLVWDGNGADDYGVLDEENCSESTPYTMQWNFIPRTDSLTNINLTIKGIPDPFLPESHTGGVYKFVTPYISGQDLIDLLNSDGVVVNFEGTTGNNPVLTISHGCSGSQIPEFPSVFLPVAAIIGLMFIFGRKREL